MVWIDLPFSSPPPHPVSLVLQGNRDARRVAWPSFCLVLSSVLSVTILRMLSQAPPQPGQSVG